MTGSMAQIDRILEFLQRLTPLTRSCLLTELERLDSLRRRDAGLCGHPGQAARRVPQGRIDPEPHQLPSRIFFAPLEPLLIDGAPEHANSGRIPRGSLAPIWEWISRDLLPTMTRDFNTQMKELIAADKQREAQQGGLRRSRPRSSNISRARSARPEAADADPRQTGGLYGVAARPMATWSR